MMTRARRSECECRGDAGRPGDLSGRSAGDAWGGTTDIRAALESRTTRPACRSRSSLERGPPRPRTGAYANHNRSETTAELVGN